MKVGGVGVEMNIVEGKGAKAEKKGQGKKGGGVKKFYLLSTERYKPD